jgi:protease II
MKKVNIILTSLLAFLVFACSTQVAVKPPVAEKIPHEVFDKRIDNYFWMRLSDDQKNDSTPDEQTRKVLKYLNDENEYYDYMLSYSPYDQVKPAYYPNLLVTTGYWDSQVQYWEPAKWVAKLRDMKTDNNNLIMDVNMSAGHGGASGRFERYRITALEYSFIIDLAGIKE